jgi:hypothetical protein
MRLRETIKKLLREEIDNHPKKDYSKSIEKLLETFIDGHKHIICDIEVTAPWNRETIEPGKSFEDYKILVKFNKGKSNANEYYDTINEIWDIVFNFFNLTTDIYSEEVKKCKDMKQEEQYDMSLNEVFGDIKGTPLYHKTSANRALEIINSDSLRAGSLPSGDYLNYDKRLANTKHKNAISFTRDKNWNPWYSIGMGLESPLEDTDIIFVVDKDKLKTKYKVEPFNYFGIESDYEYKKKNDELEERVMTNQIYPLRKYIIDIIYNGNNPKIQRKIDNYLDR